MESSSITEQESNNKSKISESSNKQHYDITPESSSETGVLPPDDMGVFSSEPEDDDVIGYPSFSCEDDEFDAKFGDFPTPQQPANYGDDDDDFGDFGDFPSPTRNYEDKLSENEEDKIKNVEVKPEIKNGNEDSKAIEEKEDFDFKTGNTEKLEDDFDGFKSTIIEHEDNFNDVKANESSDDFDAFQTGNTESVVDSEAGNTEIVADSEGGNTESQVGFDDFKTTNNQEKQDKFDDSTTARAEKEKGFSAVKDKNTENQDNFNDFKAANTESGAGIVESKTNEDENEDNEFADFGSANDGDFDAFKSVETKEKKLDGLNTTEDKEDSENEKQGNGEECENIKKVNSETEDGFNSFKAATTENVVDSEAGKTENKDDFDDFKTGNTEKKDDDFAGSKTTIIENEDNFNVAKAEETKPTVDIDAFKAENIENNKVDNGKTEDEFGDFDSKTSQNNTGSDKQETNDDDFDDFASKDATKNDDDFGDFGSGNVDNDDGFANFATANNDDDDFGGFDDIQIRSGENQDDFGDFGDTADANFGAFDDKNTDFKAFDDNDDDFGGFDDNNKADFGAFDDGNNDFGAFDNKDGDFGNFDDNNADGFGDFDDSKGDFGDFDDSNGDGFGDFDSAPQFDNQPAKDSNFSTNLKKSSSKKFTVAERLKMFERWFPYTQHDGESTIELIYSHLQNDLLSSYHSSSHQYNRPSIIWNMLKDMDSTTALKFKYEGSKQHKNLLSSLNVDPNNIVYKGTKKPYVVPAYFAASMNLLDPNTSVMKPMSAAEKIKTPTSPTPATNDQVMTSSNVTTSSTHSSTKNPTTTTEKWTTETAADQRPVPPPLAPAAATVPPSGSSQSGGGSSEVIETPASSSSVLRHDDDVTMVDMMSNFDLDYLTSIDTGKSTSNGHHQHKEQDKLDPELLQFAAMSTPMTSQSSNSLSNNDEEGGGGLRAGDKLSKLLATIKQKSTSTTKQTQQQEEEELSEEARTQLSNLPDLSYMRSPLLIFPNLK